MPPRTPLPVVALLALAACSAPADGTDAPEDPTPARGELLITELYTSGAEPAGGADHYFADQFIEVTNTTTRQLDASGVWVAEVFGSAGAINPGMTPDSFAARRPNQVVLSTVWRVPDRTSLAPGASLIIAHDGTNHRPFSTVDLSGADFEAFVVGSGQDEDHPTVPNLEEVAFEGGYDWLLTVFGPSIVLVAPDPDTDTAPGPFGDLTAVPVEAVLDGVDTLMDAASSDFKRLPPSIDAGFAWGPGPYLGWSLHRRRADGAWIDTDDASADFEVGPPDPARPSASGEVASDPQIELGTGYTAFRSLADGDEVELVAGPQGGWHVDAAVWFSDFGPDGVQLTYDAVDGDAQRLSFVTHAELSGRSVVPASPGWHRLGDRVVLDIGDADEAIGQEIVLRVTAQAGEQTWSDERRVRVVDAE